MQVKYFNSYFFFFFFFIAYWCALGLGHLKPLIFCLGQMETWWFLGVLTFGSIRVCVPVIFIFFLFFFFFFYVFVFSSVYVMSLTMSIFTFYMFVYMYVHALTPPACGLSFICNKVLFCSVLFCSSRWCQDMSEYVFHPVQCPSDSDARTCEHIKWCQQLAVSDHI